MVDRSEEIYDFLLNTSSTFVPAPPGMNDYLKKLKPYILDSRIKKIERKNEIEAIFPESDEQRRIREELNRNLKTSFGETEKVPVAVIEINPEFFRDYYEDSKKYFPHLVSIIRNYSRTDVTINSDRFKLFIPGYSMVGGGIIYENGKAIYLASGNPAAFYDDWPYPIDETTSFNAGEEFVKLLKKRSLWRTFKKILKSTY